MKLLAFAILGLVACKGHDKPAAPPVGSAPPPPPAVVPEEAGPPIATFSQIIGADGIGPVTSATDPKALAPLFPGLDVKTVHTDREGHSFDDTVLALRTGPVVLHVVVDNTLNDKQVFRIDSTGSMFATANGMRVGSTVAELVAHYPDLDCQRKTTEHDPEGFDHTLTCATASLPNVGFDIDQQGPPGTDGRVLASLIANNKVDRITWRAKVVTKPAGDTSGQPFCFEPGTALPVERIAATDEAATFCGQLGGKLTCVTVALATGAFTESVGAPPPVQVVEPVVRATADGLHKLKTTAKGAELEDAKGGKGRSLSIGDAEFGCVEDIRFLGDSIYATASACSQPRAVGFLFSATGDAIGKRLDGINLKNARPFHVGGNRWVFHSADSEGVLAVDVNNGESGTVDPMTPDQAAHPPDVKLTATIPPFAMTPGGKLVSLGAMLAVIDVSNGKVDHAWPLPTCKH